MSADNRKRVGAWICFQPSVPSRFFSWDLGVLVQSNKDKLRHCKWFGSLETNKVWSSIRQPDSVCYCLVYFSSGVLRRVELDHTLLGFRAMLSALSSFSPLIFSVLSRLLNLSCQQIWLITWILEKDVLDKHLARRVQKPRHGVSEALLLLYRVLPVTFPFAFQPFVLP